MQFGVGRNNSMTGERTPLQLVNSDRSDASGHRWREPVELDEFPSPITGFRIVDEIMARRGIIAEADALEWLNPSITGSLASADLSSFDPVLRRIEMAIDRAQSIHVFGDYDCDGVTSTAILVEALQASQERYQGSHLGVARPQPTAMGCAPM